MPDPVLDPGVGTLPGLEERQLWAQPVLLIVSDLDRRVHVDHHRGTEIAPDDLAGRQPAETGSQLGPDVVAGPWTNERRVIALDAGVQNRWCDERLGKSMWAESCDRGSGCAVAVTVVHWLCEDAPWPSTGR